jgi:hypothetical protein
MGDCRHLDVTPPQELKPGLWSEPVALCDLKVDQATRIMMAKDATTILGRLCPANTECPYYRFDLCERCPAYAL